MRTPDEIREEIDRLAVHAAAYDTISQSGETCVAAGAHDALRWALGLAEESVADGLELR